MKEDRFVYRLLKDGECIYVGITTDIKRRINQHWFDVDFDRYVVVGLFPYELARAIERRDILKLKPKHNRDIPGYRSVKNICNDLIRSGRSCSIEEVLYLINVLEVDVVDINGIKLVRVEDGKVIRSVFKELPDIEKNKAD